jgi:hypothetical protein
MGIEHINLKEAVFVENKFEVETGPMFTKFNKLATMGSHMGMGSVTSFVVLFTTGEEKKK